MSKHKKAPRIDPLDCALPAGGIDTHAHMNDPAFDEDRDEVLKRAAQCGLSHVANVFLNPETFPADAGLFRDHPEVFFLLGVHPDDARPFCQDTLDLIRTRIRECPRIRAVGEIGLDYSRPDPECTPHDVQKAAFTAQLRLAAELDMPVSIHCRDAQEDTLSILESEGFAGRPLVWHCFGGGARANSPRKDPRHASTSELERRELRKRHAKGRVRRVGHILQPRKGRAAYILLRASHLPAIDEPTSIRRAQPPA